ncbi:MAG: glycosyltransferase [Paludibacteraceae bacterium]|nr:glycosyltransferase [Paludibacteraceae bacterium]
MEKGRKWKILVVGTWHNGYLSSYVEEQILPLRALGLQVVRYGITGKGLMGYLRCLPALKRAIQQHQPDLIHAHYGLSGLLANLQRRVPVVTTYHGSDINVPAVRRFSKIAMCLSAHNIFVSQRNVTLALSPNSLITSRLKKRYTLLPCGVNLTDDQLLSRSEARKILGIDDDAKVVLFAGAFANAVKDAPLAQEAVSFASNLSPLASNLTLQELRGFSRAEVNCWMCAANCLLLTSKTEGSPQVIKEAMACGCPIVSVDVGDVAERVSGVEGCYVVRTREPRDIAQALQQAITFEGKTNGRDRILEMGLSNEQVAERLIAIYEGIV